MVEEYAGSFPMAAAASGDPNHKLDYISLTHKKGYGYFQI